MELLKVIKYLEKKFPLKLAAKWDNPGFQIFNKKELDINKDINKIMICLDINKDVVKNAVSNNVDLIISRHPFIFNDLNKEKSIKKDLIKELTKSNVLVYSIHTNYDSSPNQNIIDLLKTKFEIAKYKRFGSDKEGFDIKLKNEIKPELFIKSMNKLFNTGVVQMNTMFNLDEDIKEFKIVSGSGGSTMIETKMLNSVFVTGDAKWNELIYANDKNNSLLLLGHFMEEYFVDDIAKKLSKIIDDNVKIEKFDIKNQIKNYK